MTTGRGSWLVMLGHGSDSVGSVILMASRGRRIGVGGSSSWRRRGEGFLGILSCAADSGCIAAVVCRARQCSHGVVHGVAVRIDRIAPRLVRSSRLYVCRQPGPEGRDPDKIAPATRRGSRASPADDRANVTPNTRCRHASVTVLLNANAEPLAMAPSAASETGIHILGSLVAPRIHSRSRRFHRRRNNPPNGPEGRGRSQRHRSAWGTFRTTASTCWPQPRQVVLRHVAQRADEHMRGSPFLHYPGVPVKSSIRHGPVLAYR